MTLEEFASKITKDKHKQSIIAEALFGTLVSLMYLFAEGCYECAAHFLPPPDLLAQIFMVTLRSILWFNAICQLTLSLFKTLVELARYFESMRGRFLC